MASEKSAYTGPVLISLKEVCRITTLSRTAINKMRAAGKFPEPIYLGEKRFAFVASEFEEWLSARIAARSAKVDVR